jgi:predicted metal-dependent hydrolase
MSNRDLTLSLTIAIGFLVVISLTNMIDIRENLMIHTVEKFTEQEEKEDSGLDQPIQQFYGQEQFSSEENAKAKADMAKHNADTLKELETSIQGLESKLTDTCSKPQFDKLVDNKEATDMLKGFCNKHSVGTKEQFENYSQVVENYKF